jgi:hypothetical protein
MQQQLEAEQQECPTCGCWGQTWVDRVLDYLIVGAAAGVGAVTIATWAWWPW